MELFLGIYFISVVVCFWIGLWLDYFDKNKLSNRFLIATIILFALGLIIYTIYNVTKN